MRRRLAGSNQPTPYRLHLALPSGTQGFMRRKNSPPRAAAQSPPCAGPMLHRQAQRSCIIGTDDGGEGEDAPVTAAALGFTLTEELAPMFPVEQFEHLDSRPRGYSQRPTAWDRRGRSRREMTVITLTYVGRAFGPLMASQHSDELR